jgi:hypothetical protein
VVHGVLVAAQALGGGAQTAAGVQEGADALPQPGVGLVVNGQRTERLPDPLPGTVEVLAEEAQAGDRRVRGHDLDDTAGGERHGLRNSGMPVRAHEARHPGARIAERGPDRRCGTQELLQ